MSLTDPSREPPQARATSPKAAPSRGERSALAGRPPSGPRAWVAPVAAAVALAGLVAVLGLRVLSPEVSDAPVRADAPPQGCVVQGLAPLGGAFDLVDVNGRAVTDRDLRGVPVLLVFAPTLCSGTCGPRPLQAAQALAIAEQRGTGPVQGVFISADPSADTTDVMDRFLEVGPGAPALIGLTGSSETDTLDRPAAAAEAFGLMGPRVGSRAGGGARPGELGVFVLDEDWRVRARIDASVTDPDIIATCLEYSLAKE